MYITTQLYNTIPPKNPSALSFRQRLRCKSYRLIHHSTQVSSKQTFPGQAAQFVIQELPRILYIFHRINHHTLRCCKSRVCCLVSRVLFFVIDSRQAYIRILFPNRSRQVLRVGKQPIQSRENSGPIAQITQSIISVDPAPFVFGCVLTNYPQIPVYASPRSAPTF